MAMKKLLALMLLAPLAFAQYYNSPHTGAKLDSTTSLFQFNV